MIEIILSGYHGIWVLRGHLTRDEALAEISDCLDRDGDPEPREFGPVSHLYCRCLPVYLGRLGGRASWSSRILACERGRGAFAVTELVEVARASPGSCRQGSSAVNSGPWLTVRRGPERFNRV